jgi:hypothetical protein
MASSPTRRRVALRDGRPLFYTTCETQKQTYVDKADALDAAERLMEQGKVDPGCHLTPYTCARCGAWHIYNRRIVDLRAADGRTWPRARPDGPPDQEVD